MKPHLAAGERLRVPVRPTGVSRAAAVLLFVVLAVAGCTTSQTDDRPGPLQPPGTVPWEEALLLPGDPRLVTVSFIAGAEGPPTDPCTDQFEIDADEDRDKVQLTVREVPKAPPANATEVACSLGGKTRYVTVALDRPLGQRRLIDGARDEARAVIDATGEASRAAVRVASGAPGDAQAAGALGVDPASGCLWIEDANERTPILLAHPRYSAQLDSDPPAVLVENDVDVPAGQQVRLEGGFGIPSDSVPGCPVQGVPFVGVLSS